MTRSEKRCFLLACGLRLLMVAFVQAGHGAGGPGAPAAFAVWGGDTFSYLDPIENLLRQGTYAQDLARLETYAGRTPGYGVVYGALRLALSPGLAADALMLLQVAISLLALYCLGRLAQAATRHQLAFRWTVVVFALNTFTTGFDVRVLTESFATSALIIGSYTLVQAWERPSAFAQLRAGAWLGWAVFLRPFLAPLLLLLLVGTAVAALRRASWQRALGQALLLALPLLLADGAWMGRNWRWYQRLVPLQSNVWAGYRTAPALAEASRFVGVIGEEPTWWQPSSDIAWLYQTGPTRPNPFAVQPRKLAPPAYTADSLQRVRQLLTLAQDSRHPQPLRQQAAARAGFALRRYGTAYQRLRPLQAYLVTPVRLGYALALAHPSDYLYAHPFAELTSGQKAAKIAAHLWYLALVGLGLLGLLCAGWPPNLAAGLVHAVPIYLFVLLCGILHQVEFRYFAVGYPFVVVSAVGLLLRSWPRFKAGLGPVRRPETNAVAR